MHVLNHLPERPDAANLLRRHVTGAVHAAFETTRSARLSANTEAEWLPIHDRWLATFRAAFPPELFAMREQPVRSRALARHEREGYAIETVLFESLWGWEVNAHVCVPSGRGLWPGVVVPTGHSPKTGPAYQIPPAVFARNGLVAVTFDAPGQGEKRVGSDHFHDGVACSLTGLWSKTFFVMDALRAIDYLSSRADVDMAPGVGMTGVSGGGNTTMSCALLDERIRCIAPVCCTGPQRVLGAEDMYTSCPEAIGPRLYAAGIDVTEELAMAAPVPCLIASAELDEVYYPKMVRELVAELRHTYDLLGRPERLEHFEEPGVGHDYTATMAQHVAAWMRRWLLDDTRPAIGLSDPSAVMELAEVINCRPKAEPNMQTVNRERAAALAAARAPLPAREKRERLRALLKVADVPGPSVQSGPSEMSWWHRVERVALKTEEDLWAPALVVMNTRLEGRNPLLLWVDDRGKREALERERWLLDAAGFLADAAGEPFLHLCCLDARGWGETAPEHVAYDFAGWNDITRILSYLSVALGRSIPAQRVRDVLAALSYLRTREDVDPTRIVLGGRGAGAIVALFAAVTDGEAAGFLAAEMLASYRALVEAESFTWTHDVIVPGLLEYADIPELVDALTCPVLIVDPLDARQRPAAGVGWPPNASVRAELPSDQVGGEIAAWLRRLTS